MTYDDWKTESPEDEQERLTPRISRRMQAINDDPDRFYDEMQDRKHEKWEDRYDD